MKNANIRTIPALVAVEFPHGFEAVPTLVNGQAVRYASIDDDGVLMVWSTLAPPVLDNGKWTADSDDLLFAGMVGQDDGSTYPHAAESLRQINAAALLAA